MNAWPADNDAAITRYFGPIGAEANLVLIEPPYPMVLAWDTTKPLRKIRCHGLVAPSLRRVLASLAALYTPAELVEHGLDRWGGCYNVRKMRGSLGRWSRHSWGIAVDLDPARNGLRTPWPGEATMPLAVVEAFEAEGWLSGGRAWGCDAMHFQATST